MEYFFPLVPRVSKISMNKFLHALDGHVEKKIYFSSAKVMAT